MASNEQIQQAIQAALNAGAASGYAQALEDVVANLDLAISQLERDTTDGCDLQAAFAVSLRGNISPEIDRRKILAEREMAKASAYAQFAISPISVQIVRRAIDVLRLRPLLLQALGGAVSGKSDQ